MHSLSFTRLAFGNSRLFIKSPSLLSPFILQYHRSFQSFNGDSDDNDQLLKSLFKNDTSKNFEDSEQIPKKDGNKSILDDDFKNIFFANAYNTPEQVENKDDSIDDPVSIQSLFLREDGAPNGISGEKSKIEIVDGDKDLSNLDNSDASSGMMDPSIIHLTNMIMRDGKKARAQRYLSDCCLEIRRQTNNNPYKIIKAAIEKVSPLVGHLSLKKGSKSIQIPSPLNERQRRHKAIKWILKASDKRPGKKFGNRLALEILAVINGQSQALQQKDAVHKLALANRANLPIKW